MYIVQFHLPKNCPFYSVSWHKTIVCHIKIRNHHTKLLATLEIWCLFLTSWHSLILAQEFFSMLCPPYDAHIIQGLKIFNFVLKPSFTINTQQFITITVIFFGGKYQHIGPYPLFDYLFVIFYSSCFSVWFM